MRCPSRGTRASSNFMMFRRQVRRQFILQPRALQLLTADVNCFCGHHDGLPGPHQRFGKSTRIEYNPFARLKQFGYPGLMLIYQIYFGSETTIIDHGSESFLINVKQWHPAKFTKSVYRTSNSERASVVLVFVTSCCNSWWTATAQSSCLTPNLRVWWRVPHRSVN